MKKIVGQISKDKNTFLCKCLLGAFFLLLGVKSFSMKKQDITFLHLPADAVWHILYFAEPISQAETAYWDFRQHNDMTYFPPITLFLMYEYYKKMNYPYSLSIDSDNDYIFNKECAFLKLIEEKTRPLIIQYPIRYALKSTCKTLLHVINTTKKSEQNYFAHIPQEISVPHFFIYAKETNFFQPYMLHKSIFFGVDYCFSIASALNEKQNSFFCMYFDVKDNIITLQERSAVFYKYSVKKIWSLLYCSKIKRVSSHLPSPPPEENRLQKEVFFLDFYKKYFNNISAVALYSFFSKMVNPALCKYSTVRINSNHVQLCGVVTGIKYVVYNTVECKIDSLFPIDIIITLFKARHIQ